MGQTSIEGLPFNSFISCCAEDSPSFAIGQLVTLPLTFIIKDDSEWVKTHNNCDNYRDTYIMPQYKEL